MQGIGDVLARASALPKSVIFNVGRHTGFKKTMTLSSFRTRCIKPSRCMCATSSHISAAQRGTILKSKRAAMHCFASRSCPRRRSQDRNQKSAISMGIHAEVSPARHPSCGRAVQEKPQRVDFVWWSQRMRLYVRSLFVQEDSPRHTILKQVPRQGDPESAQDIPPKNHPWTWQVGLYTLVMPR